MSLQEATALYEAGDLRAAWAASEKALDPRRPDAGIVHLMGMIALARRRFGRAEALLSQAVALAPEEAMHHCDLALARAAGGEFVPALASLDRALAIDPECMPALHQKASALMQLNRAGEALPVMRILARRDPAPQTRLALAVCLRAVASFDEATDVLEALVAERPDCGDAWWLLASLGKAQGDRHRLDRMAAALAQLQGSSQRVPLLFAMARTLEDLERYAEAFERYREANDLRRAQLQYDLQDDRSLIAQLMNQSLPEPLTAPDGVTAVPIFVIGMPRTGSTLTEQILAAHSQVTTAGELQLLGQLAARYSRGKGGSYPQGIDAMSGEEARAMRQAYLDGSRPWRDESPFFIDKMPLNFLYLPLIVRLFPESPVIHVRRHAADTCLSSYRQLFGDFYRFSYQLEELGHWYLMYAALLNHWQSLSPGRVLDLQYESLVADPAGQARQLLGYCGLDWEPACLRPGQAGGGVLTPSAVEVRRPVHRASIGRWRHYRDELTPLLEVLARGGALPD